MHKSFLFVKAKSRLGLLNPPMGESNLNIGVEDGPDHVLSKKFLESFSQKEIISYCFSSPESVQADAYYQKLAEEYQELVLRITQKLDATKTLVTAGGDHSVSLASVATILQIYDPTSTGLIMIDSHADLHTSETTPSGNFHGMWLRALCDRFPVECIDWLVPEKIPVQNILYIGNLDVESSEKEFMSTHHIAAFGSDQVESNNVKEKISQFMKQMSHIHVSIDIDAFSHQYAPATGMRIENGLVPSEVLPILHLLTSHPSLSVDLVEVNPVVPGSKKTVHLAQQLLLKILAE